MVPTSTRTMLRMKASASITKASTSSLSSIHSARSTRRSKRTWSVSVGVKAVKSCVADERGGAAGQRLAVERPRPPERAPALERARRRAQQHAVAIGAAGGVATRVEAVGRRAPRRARRGRPAAGRSARAPARARPRGWPPGRARAPRGRSGPATVSTTSRRSTVASASSSTPWTVRRPGWRAQPANSEPSYSSSSLAVSALPALARDDHQVLGVDPHEPSSAVFELRKKSTVSLRSCGELLRR